MGGAELTEVVAAITESSSANKMGIGYRCWLSYGRCYSYWFTSGVTESVTNKVYIYIYANSVEKDARGI